MPNPDSYEHLSREQLETRLAAAERVCIVYGAAPAHLRTDREKATFMLWQKWLEIIADHPEIDQSDITDRFIFDLARKRDMQYQQVLAADRVNRKRNDAER